ncbi:hypothetical protein BKA69DRAFT_1035378 [Paraphysoderma sedebokerense]|nr:hypothetical protein BKA69DRAFT_1035378 [Paraphysoderma sedebokerense]
MKSIVFSLLSVYALIAACRAASLNTGRCDLKYQLPSFDVKQLPGTWYMYAHIPDFIEDMFTKDCFCSASNVTVDPTSVEPSSITGTVTSYCKLKSPTGDLSSTSAKLTQFTGFPSTTGIFRLDRNAFSRNEQYQILDMTEDGNNALFKSYCLYFLSKTAPKDGQNMEPVAWDRFVAKSKELDLFDEKNLRLDYKQRQTLEKEDSCRNIITKLKDAIASSDESGKACINLDFLHGSSLGITKCHRSQNQSYYAVIRPSIFYFYGSCYTETNIAVVASATASQK